MSQKITPRPSREEILSFIRAFPDQSDKRQIARAFHLRGSQDRQWLKQTLAEMADDGLIEKGHKRRHHAPGSLPKVGMIVVRSQTDDGDLIAAFGDPEESPLIFVLPDQRHAPSVGDRLLAKLSALENGHYQAKIMRILERPKKRSLMAIYRDGHLYPTDRRHRHTYRVEKDQAKGLEPGTLVVAESIYEPDRISLGLPYAQIKEVLGHEDSIAGAAQVALHTHKIRQVFPDDAIKQAEQAAAPTLGERTDLRAIPLVTIDGMTARDFDDAVYAEPDDSDQNPDGWKILVAIADVAQYVWPDSPLDKEAFQRGNSVYLPDRVVPMLPHQLSNGWCSLNPHEDRACLAVWITIDAKGKMLKSRFVRGLMRSHARLTYEQVQAYRDGNPTDNIQGLETALDHLYGAFEVLAQARSERGTLELNLPEYELILNEDQNALLGVHARSRLDSHRLIEEMMILANVAAAKTLEKQHQSLIYRVHDAPDAARVEALKTVLRAFDLPMRKNQSFQPHDFNKILAQIAGKPGERLVNESILRSQSQAVYTSHNGGHFGLALTSYAHFTSPIRRYADLIVHRALIKALKLPSEDQAERLPPHQERSLEAIGEHISQTERAAAQAERDCKERIISAHLAEQTGAMFTAEIVSVTSFGLFLSLPDWGVQGLLPFAGLPDDRYHLTSDNHQAIGQHNGEVFSLGDRLQVILEEVNATTASLTFRLENRITKPMPPVERLQGVRRQRRGGSRVATRSKRSRKNRH